VCSEDATCFCHHLGFLKTLMQFSGYGTREKAYKLDLQLAWRVCQRGHTLFLRRHFGILDNQIYTSIKTLTFTCFIPRRFYMVWSWPSYCSANKTLRKYGLKKKCLSEIHFPPPHVIVLQTSLFYWRGHCFSPSAPITASKNLLNCLKVYSLLL